MNPFRCASAELVFFC